MSRPDQIEHPAFKRDIYAAEGKLAPAKANNTGAGIVGHTAEGVEVIVPRLLSEYWIDPAGNKVSLVLTSNRAGTEAARDAAVIRQTKAAKGWRAWNSFSSDAERDAFVAARQERHRMQSEKYRSAWATVDEAEALRTEKAMTEGLSKFFDKLDKLNAAAPAPAAPAKKDK